jgi:Ca2+-binding RTX toxin-like protein
VENWYSSENYRIESLSFSDGINWDQATIHEKGLSYYGTESAETIVGIGEHNTFYGLGGDDILGGDQASADYTGQTYIDGINRGNDYHGGTGNDTLRGSRYSNHYYFNAGDGQDLIQEYSTLTTAPTDSDRIILGAGITESDLQLTNDGSNLIIDFANSTDQIQVENWYSSENYRIESLSFNDGTTWDQATIHEKGLSYYGTETAETIVGIGEHNTFYGLGGDDILGGDQASADYTGQTAIDGINRGNDYHGGTGNDTLRGSRYSNHYYFNAGDGQDLIQEYSTLTATPTDSDRIILGEGITESDLQLTNDGSNLIINFTDSTDQIQVENWYSSDYYRIESLSFNDGTIWDQATIHEKGLSYYGTETAETIVGIGEHNTFYGLGGDDVLGGAYASIDYYGYTTIDGIRRGNDYHAGTGDDTINGTRYSDHYYFNSGGGQDLITDYNNYGTDHDSWNTDRIILGEGNTTDNVWLSSVGSNLIINFANSSDQITIDRWYDGWQRQIEELEFADGTVLDQATMHLQGLNIYGTDGDDTLTATSASSYTNGVYYSNEFHGGTGNDTITGARYSNHYYFNSGDGQDVITDLYNYGTDHASWNTDRIILGEGITETDLQLTNDGSGLIINFSNTTDQITVASWYDNWQNRIEELEFADGTIWDQDTMHYEGLAIYGTEQADTLVGANGYDVIRGMAGDDILGGDQSSADYTGQTTLDGINRGNDYYGGTGNDTLRGTNYSDHYHFNAGDGQDLIQEYSTNTTLAMDSDTIILGEGITEADLQLGRDVDNLIINIVNSTDQIQVENWYANDFNRIEFLNFSDGTIWEQTSLHDKGITLTGTDQTDTVVGTDRFDILQGLAGDDTLGGDLLSVDYTGFTLIDNINRGNDYHGGIGNDTLRGTEHSDNYFFNAGDGQDLIQEESSNTDAASDSDTIILGAGITTTDLHITNDGNNLIIDFANSSDQIQIENWYVSDINRVESLSFSDGTVWNETKLHFTGLAIYGTDQTDTLEGTDSLNFIYGYAGDDILGGDQISADYTGFTLIDDINRGNDYHGGSGNDTLRGTQHSDNYFFNSGDGQDLIQENSSNTDSASNSDMIILGAGITTADLQLSRDVDNLIIDFANPGDQIQVEGWYASDQNRIESLAFTDGIVWDKTTLHDKGITLTGSDQADTIVGTDRLDILQGLAGNDTLGGEQDSADYSGFTLLDGINRGNDYYGGTGNDTLRGTQHSDHYYFNAGDGQDLIRENSSNTDSASNSDMIILGAGITTTDLQLSRDVDNLIIDFANPGDQIQVEGWYASEQNRIESLTFDDGTVWDKTTLHDKGITLTGTVQADTIVGTDRLDILHGLAGDDTLGGDQISADYSGFTLIDGINRGNDYHGGIGNDSLRGTEHSDHYYFNAGDGQDLIEDYSSNTNIASDSDKIILGSGITANDLHVSNDGSNLIINFKGSSDEIHVASWYDSDLSRIESLLFDDGTVWDQPTLHAKGISTEFDITGTQEADTLTGGSSYDKLFGLDGDDILGGDQASTDYSGSYEIGALYRGNDYYGGLGNDTLRGTKYSDHYIFNAGDGQDIIQEYSTLTSTSEDSDQIIMGEGITANDLQITNDGNSLIINFANSTDQIQVENWYVDDYNRIESISFADNTEMDQTTIHNQGLTSIIGTDDSETIVGIGKHNTLYARAGDDVLGGEYGSADYWGYTNIAGINRGNDYFGGIGNDTLLGTNYTDHYYFNTGDGVDLITDYYATSNNYTYNNTDHIILGAGITTNDVRLGSEGSNLIIDFNNSSDQITITGWYDGWRNQVEELEFADGTIWNASTLHAGGLNIYGTDGDDALTAISTYSSIDGINYGNKFTGGLGNDSLQGNSYSNTYYFNGGDGVDLITDYYSASNNYSYNNSDRIILGAGITEADLQLTNDGSNLLINFNNSSDQIQVANWYDTWRNQLEYLEFADGTVWNNATIHSKGLSYYGDDTAETMVGIGQHNTFYAMGGDDVLGGEIGSADYNGNTLINGIYRGNDYFGGIGNDTLQGTNFADHYYFNTGDGVDVITDYYSTSNGYSYYNSDRIILGSGITTADVRLGSEGSNLIINFNNSSDQITITGWYDGWRNHIEELEFADGTIWNSTTMQAKGLAIYGTDGDDAMTAISATSYTNGIYYSSEFHGGSGNDTMSGNDYTNTYHFNAGDGVDIITDYYAIGNNYAYYNSDRIILGAGITEEDLQLKKEGSELIIDFKDSSDQINVANWYVDWRHQLEFLEFADGTVWDQTTIHNKGMSAIHGSELAETLNGDGNDNTIYGYAGDDTIDGAAGHDILMGDEGNDILGGVVNSADYTGNTTIDGINRGNDYYGGIGNDTLRGTAHSDHYYFNVGDGQELIQEYSASTLTASNQDQIILGAGISESDVLLTSIDNDLIVDFVNSSDQITVENWYSSDSYRVESLVFADGTVLDKDTMHHQGGFIRGSELADSLVGTTKLDSFFGYAGDDILGGNTSSTDYSSFNLIDGFNRGNDYYGGTGNDILQGTKYSDFYFFNVGDGQDRIKENSTLTSNSSDSDRIILGTGITASDLQLSTSNHDLIIDVGGNDDQILVENWFASENHRIEFMVFADGSVWDQNTIQSQGSFINGTILADTISGNDSDNTIFGNEEDDILEGVSGQDTLMGGTGNDILDGGADHDVLHGEDGDDTLGGVYGSMDYTGFTLINGINLGNDYYGGSGNDTLRGTKYSDHYHFNIGDGQDLIQEDSGLTTIASNSDQIIFGVGISETDLQLANNGSDLIIKLTNGSDQITMNNWYSGNNYRVESLAFADGTIWNQATIHDQGLLTVVRKDALVTDEDAQLIFSEVELLANASDVYGDNLSISGLTAESGSLVDNGDSTWTFTPDADSNGTVNLSYNIIDGSETIPATATLEVTAINDAPIVGAEIVLASDEDAQLVISETELLVNASDVDGDNLSISDLTTDSGTFLDNGDRTWTFTPNSNFNGDVFFDYIISDGNGGSKTTTATVNVNQVNDNPSLLAEISDTTINEGDSFSMDISSAFTDIDVGDILTYSASQTSGDPLPSWLVIDSTTGVFSGVPADADTGLLDITVSATDGAGATVVDTFNLQINDVTVGSAVDGYVEGATVFADANNNGILDAGESFSTTDANGGFTLIGGSGPLIMMGGVDVSTGLAFQGQMRATAGSSVITPLTTMTASLVDNGATIEEAQASVLSGLGLDTAIDLKNFDPVSMAANGDSIGAAVLAAGIQIQNSVVQMASLLDGAGNIGVDAAIDSIFAEMAGQLGALSQGQELDLSDSAVIGNVLDAAASTTQIPVEAINDVKVGAALVIASANSAIEQAVTDGNIGVALITELAKVAVVAQGDSSTALASAGSSGDTASMDAVVADYTGDGLNDALDQAESQVGDVDGADVVSTSEDIAYVFTENDFPGQIKIAQLPSSGVLNLNGTAVTVDTVISTTEIAAGELTFLPEENSSGVAYSAFEYLTHNGTDFNSVAEIMSINIVPISDTPSLVADNVVGDEDSAIALNIAAALTDLDGSETLDLLSISGVPEGVVLSAGTNLGNGIWSLDADQSSGLTLTPVADFNGSFTLSVTATSTESANGDSASSTVNFQVDVDAVNDTPVANGEHFNTAQNTPVTLTAVSMLANDTDVDGDILTIDSLGGSIDGSVAFDGNGDVLFTPDTDFYGLASFEYTVSDGNGGLFTTTSTVTTLSGSSVLGTGLADNLVQSSGDHTFLGLAGNDTMDGGSGLDVYVGGAGDDLLGGLYDGADYFGHSLVNGVSLGNYYYGGTGNDTLRGGYRGNKYYFNSGDGQDLIQDNGANTSMLDRIILGEGITESDLQLSNDGSNLIIDFINSSDQIQVENWYINQKYRMEFLEFADGTVWNQATMYDKGLDLQGTVADDTLLGTREHNTFYGAAGDDVLGAAYHSDLYFGSTLIDGIYRGNDYYGGTGNDTLRGTYYADYYHFNSGDGQDLIQDNDILSSTTDKIILGAGITETDLQLSNDGSNLIIDFVNSSDQIQVENWYINAKYRIESLEFADGTTWDEASISALGGGIPDVSGNTEHNILNGTAGDDLIGGAYDSVDYYSYQSIDGVNRGNDYYGGTGNDTLRGTYYSDYYHFNLGDGQDLIQDNSTGSSAYNNDRIMLGAGITDADIQIGNDGMNLIIDFINSTDRITVENWYVVNTAYQMEYLEFDDGTIWDKATLHNYGRAQYGTDSSDLLEGNYLYNSLNGFAGDDILGGEYDSKDYYGYQYFGGQYRGNDYYGGTGNDTLRGTYYSDFYHFNQGDGQDTIQDNSAGSSAYNSDKIILGAGISEADIQISLDGTNLLVDFLNSTDRITINNWTVADHRYRIESLEFDNGMVWDKTLLNYKRLSQYGTEGVDELAGDWTFNTLHGLGGDDTLGGVYGSSDYTYSTNLNGVTRGNDYYGGAGNDLLRGTNSSDYYYFNAGDGQDTIQDNSSNVSGDSNNSDKVVFGQDINAIDIIVGKDEDDNLTLDEPFAL